MSRLNIRTQLVLLFATSTRQRKMYVRLQFYKTRLQLKFYQEIVILFEKVERTNEKGLTIIERAKIRELESERERERDEQVQWVLDR